MRVTAAAEAKAIEAGNSEEFFTEHYWGFTKRGRKTAEYAVLHPRWNTYAIAQHSIDVDFGALYGKEFATLAGRVPESILLAEGSEIEVRSGERLATGRDK